MCIHCIHVHGPYTDWVIHNSVRNAENIQAYIGTGIYIYYHRLSKLLSNFENARTLTDDDNDNNDNKDVYDTVMTMAWSFLFSFTHTVLYSHVSIRYVENWKIKLLCKGFL